MSSTNFLTIRESLNTARTKARTMTWADTTHSVSFTIPTTSGERELFFDRDGKIVGIMLNGDYEPTKPLGDHAIYGGWCVICGEDEDFLSR